MPAVDMPVDGEVAVDINVHMMPVPVTPPPGIPPGRPHDDADTKGEKRPRHIARRIVNIGRIGGIPPGAIDNARVVNWNVDHLGTRRFDADDLLFDHDFLLGRRLEMTRRMGFGAQGLDGIHDVFLLRHERIA